MYVYRWRRALSRSDTVCSARGWVEELRRAVDVRARRSVEKPFWQIEIAMQSAPEWVHITTYVIVEFGGNIAFGEDLTED